MKVCNVKGCGLPTSQKARVCGIHKGRWFRTGFHGAPTATCPYPIAPFLSYAQKHYGISGNETAGEVNSIARALHISKGAAWRHLVVGTVKESTMDSWCCKVGVHISELYPEYWDNANQLQVEYVQ